MDVEQLPFDLDLNFDGDRDLMFGEPMNIANNETHPPSSVFNTPRRLKRKVIGTPDYNSSVLTE